MYRWSSRQVEYANPDDTSSQFAKGSSLVCFNTKTDSQQSITLWQKSHVSQVKRAVLAYSCSVRDKEYYIKMRHKSKVEEQKMARLKDRIIPDEPPFSLVGVDYFGPFEVKVKRSHVKRYGVIFTCLASRAVHLEVAASLDTDSYINALRRFMARRGHVKRIRSDNGTWTGSLIRRISSRRNRGKDYQINPKGNE